MHAERLSVYRMHSHQHLDVVRVHLDLEDSWSEDVRPAETVFRAERQLRPARHAREPLHLPLAFLFRQLPPHQGPFAQILLALLAR